MYLCEIWKNEVKKSILSGQGDITMLVLQTCLPGKTSLAFVICVNFVVYVLFTVPHNYVIYFETRQHSQSILLFGIYL